MRKLDANAEVDERLNGQLAFYAREHGVDLSQEEEVDAEGPLLGGTLYGGDPCVFYAPALNEIGALPRRDARRYLATGKKPGE